MDPTPAGENSRGKPTRPPSVPIRRAARGIGEHLGAWRRLRGLTSAQVAERAGITRTTLRRLEAGTGVTSLENVLRVARALGVLDGVVAAFDPFRTDIGRLRAEEQLPTRVRHRRRPPTRE